MLQCWRHERQVVLGCGYAYNPTGFVPQFRGTPVSTSELGYSLGRPANQIQPEDDVASRRGYSGLYRFGGVYNPAHFPALVSAEQIKGNVLLYWAANQALWRVDHKSDRGLDGEITYDWSPANRNRQNRELTAGLRWNEPFPIRTHHTISVGYVRDSLSDASSTSKRSAEHGVEFNALVSVTGAVTFQPTLEYFAHDGGGTQHAFIAGFRTRIDF